MQYPQINQRNYTEQLGTGVGTPISQYGCALVCVDSVMQWFGKGLDVLALNDALNQHEGFASNGRGATNLIKWGAITQLFADVTLVQNTPYPTTPANMGIVDTYLSKRIPVIVGVSFTHDPKATQPSHYVVLYQKNSDGTYQAMDPWFGDSTVFDKRYAVNSMSVAQCILQIVAYNGPVSTEEPLVQPHASPQQALQLEDSLRAERDRNWNMYQETVRQLDTKDGRIIELEGQVKQLDEANSELKKEIQNISSQLATVLDSYKKRCEADSAAVDEGIKAEMELKEKKHVVEQVASALKTDPTLPKLLSQIDTILSQRQAMVKSSASLVTLFFSKFGKQPKEVKTLNG
jgi:hypothetical protein